MTRDSHSASRKSKNFRKHTKSVDGELLPQQYDKALMHTSMLSKKVEDPFKEFGVSREDKMTFFLLKWVFNAIKLDSDKDDKNFKGQPYVTKSELVK